VPRPISVLQVCSASELIYGAAHSLMTLADAQRQAGKRVEFLAFKGKRFARQVRDRGYTVHEIKVRAKIDPFALIQMKRLISGGGYDIVHTHLSTSSVNGCIAAKLAGVPSIATVHGMSSKFSFGFADHMIGVSDQVREHLVSQGVAPGKISVVYNGLVLPTRVDKRIARGLLGIPNDAIVLGTVSRVTAMKGIDDAIKAFAAIATEFPTAIYLVVGDGDALEGCRSLAASLGVSDRIRFEGYKTNVPLYLSAMDVFVFPSLKEAMGIALIEAMAARLPSVASDVDGIPEVLTPESGVLVPVKSPDAIAKQLRRLLMDSSLCEAMGQNARLRVEEKFSAGAMEKATELVYGRLLGSSHQPREDLKPLETGV
jgi:glycosyltransferase involved in cell wall biosynthesis